MITPQITCISVIALNINDYVCLKLSPPLVSLGMQPCPFVSTKSPNLWSPEATWETCKTSSALMAGYVWPGSPVIVNIDEKGDSVISLRIQCFHQAPSPPTIRGVMRPGAVAKDDPKSKVGSSWVCSYVRKRVSHQEPPKNDPVDGEFTTLLWTNHHNVNFINAQPRSLHHHNRELPRPGPGETMHWLGGSTRGGAELSSTRELRYALECTSMDPEHLVSRVSIHLELAPS